MSKSTKKEIWVTKEGERIPVREMTDSHLSNAIAYLKRRIEALEKLEDDYEDWSDMNARIFIGVAKTQGAISMLQKEQQRRQGVVKKEEKIQRWIEIDLEGPGLMRVI